MDSFQGLITKSPSSWNRPLAPSLNFYDNVNPVTRRTIDQSAGGKLRDLNAKESWALLEDLALYDNESWNDPRDFAKPIKATALPQNVSSTPNRRLIELENQVQHLMEAHLALTQPTQVNKVTTSCEICSGPHDTQYCMKDPEQAFVEYTSSRTDESGGLINTIIIHSEKQSGSYDENAKENEEEEKDSPKNINVNPSTPPDPSVAFITEKVFKFNSFFESIGLVPRSSNTEAICIKGDDREVMFVELIRKNNKFSEGEPEEEGSTTTKGVGVEYFDMFPTRKSPINLKIPCNIRHVHVDKAYIDPNSPLNIMTGMMYNWIMRRELDPRENSNKGVSNFTRRFKRMHVFIGNFSYIIDFMIVEDVSSIIDPRLSQVVLGKPFVEISNMTHDSPEGVVRFTNGTKEVAYKMPRMIEPYNSRRT
uniref:MAK10-like protein n=1 Tax=Tanacetum cinerariifolium TaxID=118510 RepID=A0A699HSE4_TANCI|nr:MAK10-like protein [Tanacetum cinerariifolium]